MTVYYGIPGGTLRGEGKTARGDQRGAISEGKTARGELRGRGVRGEGREARGEGRGASVSSEMRELSREGTSDVQQRLAIILYLRLTCVFGAIVLRMICADQNGL